MQSNSPYWDWVKGVGGGVEPFENNPETLADPSSIYPKPSATNKGASFALWLATGYHKLTERQKQVFLYSFRLEKADNAVAHILGIIPRRVKQIKKRLREIIAANVGGVR